MRSCCTNARQACKTLPGTSLEGPQTGPCTCRALAWKGSQTTCKTAARTSLEGPETGPCTCCAVAWKVDRQLAKQLHGQAWKARRQALAPAAQLPGKLTDNLQNSCTEKPRRPTDRPLHGLQSTLGRVKGGGGPGPSGAACCLGPRRAAAPQPEPSPKPHHGPTLKPNGRPAELR